MNRAAERKRLHGMNFSCDEAHDIPRLRFNITADGAAHEETSFGDFDVVKRGGVVRVRGKYPILVEHVSGAARAHSSSGMMCGNHGDHRDRIQYVAHVEVQPLALFVLTDHMLIGIVIDDSIGHVTGPVRVPVAIQVMFELPLTDLPAAPPAPPAVLVKLPALPEPPVLPAVPHAPPFPPVPPVLVPEPPMTPPSPPAPAAPVVPALPLATPRVIG